MSLRGNTFVLCVEMYSWIEDKNRGEEEMWERVVQPRGIDKPLIHRGSALNVTHSPCVPSWIQVAE